MATLHLLGTGSANTSAQRTTTMLAVNDGRSTIVIDCGGDLVQRLLSAGLDLDTVEALIVTHEHPDHVSGFPLFMEKIWLGGRRRPIAVYGIDRAIGQARRIWEAFDTERWTGVPEVHWNEVALEEHAGVLSDEHWQITASPGVHGVPVVGLRVLNRTSRTAMTYSCDTEPCDSIARLASGSSLLVHEANGEGPGHSSATQAATIARSAGVDRLVLVHLPAATPESEVHAAAAEFGHIELGEELGSYEF